MRTVWIATVLALMFAGCVVETDVPPVSAMGADAPPVSTTAPVSLSASETAPSLPAADEQAIESLCTRYIEMHYNAELLGEAGDPAPLFADGLACDYAVLKIGLFAERWSQKPREAYNLSITTAVQEAKTAGDEISAVVKVGVTYKNNAAGSSVAERRDAFHFRLINKDGGLVIADVFNFDAIDTACRGVTPQSVIDSHKIAAENVEALQGLFAKPAQRPIDELTLRVLTPDGKPVPNLGVYGNPRQSAFLASSTISNAVTDNEGIAILQRVHAGEAPNEAITVGLTDRNQSDVIQQKVTVAMPDSDSAYEPQTIVWNKALPTDYLKEQTDTITLTIVNTEGEALPNMWVTLGLPARTAADGSNNDMGYQEALPYADRQLITGADGTCTFGNVGKGTYSIGLCGVIASFNLVPSDNPRLQAERIYADKSIWGDAIDYTEGGKQAFTLEFVPYAS